MRPITLFLAAIAIVLIAVLTLLLLQIIGFRQVQVQLACGPELVQNGSFEEKDFPGGGFAFLTDTNDPKTVGVTANCRRDSNVCLQNWTIGAASRQNNLVWFQNGSGIGGVPSDPNPNEKRFLNMSATTHADPFPPVAQTIPADHVDAGSYQLQFDLGQGGGQNAPPEFSGPVSLTVEISGVITNKLQFTSDANGALWQTKTLMLTAPNSGDITLTFQASQGQKKPFIGLDNVSLQQLRPVSACLSS